MTRQSDPAFPGRMYSEFSNPLLDLVDTVYQSFWHLVHRNDDVPSVSSSPSDTWQAVSIYERHQSEHIADHTQICTAYTDVCRDLPLHCCTCTKSFNTERARYRRSSLYFLCGVRCSVSFSWSSTASARVCCLTYVRLLASFWPRGPSILNVHHSMIEPHKLSANELHCTYPLLLPHCLINLVMSRWYHVLVTRNCITVRKVRGNLFELIDIPQDGGRTFNLFLHVYLLTPKVYLGGVAWHFQLHVHSMDTA